MKRYLVMSMLAVLGSIVPLFISTPAIARDAHSEEHMTQHDGGDRPEYLQEMEDSDPEFYVPPINDGIPPAKNNNEPSN